MSKVLIELRLLAAGSTTLTSCGSNENTKTEEPAMKCGEGKCGDSMKEEKTEKVIPEKADTTQEEMKCGEGKCGNSM